MPNWCEGNIRFRGDIDDIVRFFKEGIIAYKYSDEMKNVKCDTEVKVVKSDYDDYIEEIHITTDDSRSWFHIDNTHRNFIGDDNTIDIWDVYKNNDGSYIVILDEFKAAWSIELEPYVEISKKYNIDIHIFGWEKGMEFDQEIEIVKGVPVKNDVHDGKNWAWETAMPYFGG